MTTNSREKLKIKVMALCLIASTMGVIGVSDTITPLFKDPVPNAAPRLPDIPDPALPKTLQVTLAQAETSLKTGTQTIGSNAKTVNSPSENSEDLMELLPAWVDAPFRTDYSMFPAENQKVINKWYSMGAGTGQLGQPWSYLTCSSDGFYCYEEFERGIIYTIASQPSAYFMYRTPESNIWTQSNPNSLMFTQAPKNIPGGPYGWPTSDPVYNGDTVIQQFEQAIIYSDRSSGAGQVLMRNHPITAQYITMGSHASALGYPAGNVVSSPGGSSQRFANGTIYIANGSAPQIIMNSSFIAAKYASLGGETGTLGYPVTALTGNQQKFQNGAIYSVAAGVVVVEGATYTSYKANGSETGALGLPTGNKVTTPQGNAQSFVNGKIYSGSSGTQVFLNSASIATKYNSLGAESGTFGYPVGNQVCSASGCCQKFQKGLIHLATGGTFFIVTGDIYTKYNAVGGPSSYLGLPTGDVVTVNGQSIQRFKGGTMGSDTTGIRDYINSECDTLTNGKSKYEHSNANRVTFAIAEGYGQYQANILNCKKIAGTYLLDWKTAGTVGQNGFKAPGVASGPTRNMYSPTGSYSVTEAFGLGNPGTALPYQQLNSNSRWGGNPYSWSYNKYVEYSGPAIGYDENMWNFATMQGRDYVQGAVINYNRPPDVPSIVQDAGFAIFLHANPVPTAGCIAIDEGNVVRWLQTATPGDRIIMGVRSDLFNV
jgi:uncharacterized protein with LGFP repeats/L,D-peptidoglycan transpeptidase YkuD (ErfK/YbiS/YcfS/YnhG family)